MKIKKRIFVCWVLLAGFLPVSPLAQGENATQEKVSNIRYEIWVELDDANKMLYGKEEIIWQNTTKDEIPDMYFHLYYNAFKNEKSTMNQEAKEESLFGTRRFKEGEWGWVDVTSIRLADGRDLKPTMEFVTQDEPIQPGDQTVMRVRFPKPLEHGEDVHLQIEFQSKIPKSGTRSSYYQNSYFIAQWFPKPGVYEEGRGWNCHEYHLDSEFFADYAEFIVHITVPENFVVGASGKQVQVEPDKNKKTVTYTFHQENIHDFAWTTTPHFIKVERDFIAEKEVTPQEYEDIASRLQLQVEEVKLPNVKMILLIEPEHKSQIDRHFKALRMALKYYGLWYGSYPYETVTMVDPPFRTGSGGMEYPTLFTAGTSAFKSAKVLSPEMVIIHEFGHGYWYGLAGNNEFEEAWLDEGINTYSTGKVSGKAYGRGMFSMRFKGFPLAWFFNLPEYYDFEADRALAINVVQYDPIETFSWKFYNRASYGLNVYMRASICLNTLERLVGEDVMLGIMRTFQTRFRYKHPHMQDFIDVASEIAGKDLSWFFKEFFFNTLNFDYGISSLRSCEKKGLLGVFDINGKKEEITLEKITKKEKEKKRKDAKKTFITDVKVRRFGEAKIGGDAQVKLKVVFDDGSEEVRLWDGQLRWQKFRFEKAAKPLYAQIDPENIWLIDSNLANNSLKLEAARGGNRKITARFFFWVQNVLQLLSLFS